MRGSALFRLAAGALSAAALAACATTPSTSTPPPPVTAPELKIVAEPVGPDALEAYDAETLLLRGLDLLDGGAWSDAADYFERLIREFPTDPRVVLAQYNRGVAYIHLGRGDEAVAAFDAYLAGLGTPTTAAGAKDVLDGRFKRGQALAVAKRYEEVVALFDEMLGEELSPDDRIEALVDAGVGHYMLGLAPGGDEMHRPTAEYRFLEARRIVRKESEKRRMDHMQFFVAQSSFYLAELAHLDFSEYKLTWPTAQELADASAKAKAGAAKGKKAPPSTSTTNASTSTTTDTTDTTEAGVLEKLLGEKLEEKCQRLLRAQYQYLRAIRENHPGWASAAGYNVGRMYEELHEEMVGLPAPDDLTDAQKELYAQMVRKKVLILLEKAEKTWTQTAEMVVRTGAEGEWGDKTKKALENVRRRLVEENTALATLDAEEPTLPMADSGKGKGKS